jgi:hypothetical protein
MGQNNSLLLQLTCATSNWLLSLRQATIAHAQVHVSMIQKTQPMMGSSGLKILTNLYLKKLSHGEIKLVARIIEGGNNWCKIRLRQEKGNAFAQVLTSCIPYLERRHFYTRLVPSIPSLSWPNSLVQSSKLKCNFLMKIFSKNPSSWRPLTGEER